MSEKTENFTSTGMEFAARHNNYASNIVIDLKTDYKYECTDNTYNTANYLKGASTDLANAMGKSNTESYWGFRDTKNIYSNEFYKINIYSQKNKVPLVYKNYGLIPVARTSASYNTPFAVNRTFTSDTYLRYNDSKDYCEYSSNKTNWDKLNDGPGIFCIMAGGGGAGANGSAGFPFSNYGGGGGGGGSSAIFYVDLKALQNNSNGNYIRFYCGKGGEPAKVEEGTSKNRGAAGNPGTDSHITFNDAITVINCPGGKGGGTGGTKKGGAGGVYSIASDYKKYFCVFAGYNGKKGGDNEDEGGNFDSSVNINVFILNNKPKETYGNTSFGAGGDKYRSSSEQNFGGGGGASIISYRAREQRFSLLGYGGGGHGGSSKDNDYWIQAQKGSNGCLMVLTLE